MKSTIQTMYENHHKTARGEGFSILKKERGNLFKNLVGKNKTILDIGCRDGALTSFFVESNTVLGVDIDEVSLQKAKDNLAIDVLLFDLQSDWSVFNQKKFDVVVAGEILEHVFYPERVIENVSSVLSSEGVFIGSVPNAFSLKNRLRYLWGTKKYTPLSDPTHINHFSAKELEMMLKKYFSHVSIIGLGRGGFLARLYPQLFAFDLCFEAKK